MAHGSRSEVFVGLRALNGVPVGRFRCFLDDMALTMAKRPFVSFTGASPSLDSMDVAVLDPHAVAHTQVEVAPVFDDQRAPRIEPHGDAVSRGLFLSFSRFRFRRARRQVRRRLWRQCSRGRFRSGGRSPAMPPTTAPPLTGLLSGAR